MKSPVELRYITIVQIVGCCLVVLGHSFPFVTPYPSGVTKSISFLYAFHMPLFVWCSGFLFAHTMQSDRKSLAQYTGNRAVKLLVPYFVISLIGLIPKILASSVLNDKLNVDVISIVRAFLVPREGVWGHFWFLPMIYLMGTLGYLLDKFSKKTQVWAIVVLVSFALSFYRQDVLQWFAVNDVLQYFMFYGGYFVLQAYKKHGFLPLVVYRFCNPVVCCSFLYDNIQCRTDSHKKHVDCNLYDFRHCPVVQENRQVHQC